MPLAPTKCKRSLNFVWWPLDAQVARKARLKLPNGYRILHSF